MTTDKSAAFIKCMRFVMGVFEKDWKDRLLDILKKNYPSNLTSAQCCRYVLDHVKDVSIEHLLEGWRLVTRDIYLVSAIRDEDFVKGVIRDLVMRIHEKMHSGATPDIGPFDLAIPEIVAVSRCALPTCNSCERWNSYLARVSSGSECAKALSDADNALFAEVRVAYTAEKAAKTPSLAEIPAPGKSRARSFDFNEPEIVEISKTAENEPKACNVCKKNKDKPKEIVTEGTEGVGDKRTSEEVYERPNQGGRDESLKQRKKVQIEEEEEEEEDEDEDEEEDEIKEKDKAPQGIGHVFSESKLKAALHALLAFTAPLIDGDNGLPDSAPERGLALAFALGVKKTSDPDILHVLGNFGDKNKKMAYNSVIWERFASIVQRNSDPDFKNAYYSEMTSIMFFVFALPLFVHRVDNDALKDIILRSLERPEVTRKAIVNAIMVNVIENEADRKEFLAALNLAANNAKAKATINQPRFAQFRQAAEQLQTSLSQISSYVSVYLSRMRGKEKKALIEPTPAPRAVEAEITGPVPVIEYSRPIASQPHYYISHSNPRMPYGSLLSTKDVPRQPYDFENTERRSLYIVRSDEMAKYIADTAQSVRSKHNDTYAQEYEAFCTNAKQFIGLFATGTNIDAIANGYPSDISTGGRSDLVENIVKLIKQN